MITGVHHTGMAVRDLDAAIAFYATQGAFRDAGRYWIADNAENRRLLDVGNASAQVALLEGTLGCIELFEFVVSRNDLPLAHAVPSSGIRHICLQTAIDDVLFDAMAAAGATSHARPGGLGTGNSYVYIRDPEGNVLELEGVPWAQAGITRPWYAHTAIVTPDIDRLSAFYAMIASGEIHRRGTFGPNPMFDNVAGISGVRFHGAWMRLPNAELEFWQYLEPASVPAPRRLASDLGWNHLCFESDDLGADYQRLEAAGVELHGPPHGFGNAEVFFGRDPDGNIFEVLEPVAGKARITVATMLASPDGRLIDDARTAFRSAAMAAATRP